MPIPQTRYAKSGDLHIAYQVVGDGPTDLVLVPGWVSNVALLWEDPGWRAFLERLASFSRLILFDKRGTGLSDRVAIADLPTLEERIDDVRAVMDAAGSTAASLFGISEGGPMSVLFAASHPERVRALVLYGSFPRITSGNGYPWGFPLETAERLLATAEATWGQGTFTGNLFAPDDLASRLAFFARFERDGASPGAMEALVRMLFDIDVRDVLPTISVPTLIIHRDRDAMAPIEGARYMAEQIPNAKLVELSGSHSPISGDRDAILDAVEEFLTGSRPSAAIDSVLATVMFIDIVGSTVRAATEGDANWSRLLEAHHTTVRRELERFRGREMDTAGDGLLALFDGPARAVQAACAIRDELQSLGLQVRAAVHTGDCIVTADSVRGITVHIGARLAALAQPGEVLVSGTVRDLTPGAKITFDPRGKVELPGVAGTWEVLAVADERQDPARRDAAAALSLLNGLDAVSMSSFAVVGAYSRFDEGVRNQLQDLRTSVAGSLENASHKRNAYLIQAAPGSGKTYFVEQVAASLRDVVYREINLAKVDVEGFREGLGGVMASNGTRRLCFIDECDAKPDQSWPYEVLLPFLDDALRQGAPVSFILAGSYGQGVDQLRDHMASRPKGADLVSRIPASNMYRIEALGMGDRLLVALSHLGGASREMGRDVTAVEKMALFCVLLDKRLESARQIREFAVRAAGRLGPAEDRVKYDHIFSPGDPENKAFWARWRPHHWALVNHFLAVRD